MNQAVIPIYCTPWPGKRSSFFMLISFIDDSQHVLILRNELRLCPQEEVHLIDSQEYGYESCHMPAGMEITEELVLAQGQVQDNHEQTEQEEECRHIHLSSGYFPPHGQTLSHNGVYQVEQHISQVDRVKDTQKEHDEIDLALSRSQVDVKDVDNLKTGHQYADDIQELCPIHQSRMIHNARQTRKTDHFDQHECLSVKLFVQSSHSEIEERDEKEQACQSRPKFCNIGTILVVLFTRIKEEEQFC